MRALSLVALVAALALPHVAAAQTPSVTPPPEQITLTFRFDCGAVPWSCGNKPTDIRWQLWRGTRCEAGQKDCQWTRDHIVEADKPLPAGEPGKQVQMRLFLGPISAKETLVNRCDVGTGGGAGLLRLTILSWCAVNGAACAGPANWQLYYTAATGELVQRHKHIENCSGTGIGGGFMGTEMVMHWGLPGELSAAPTAAATMTPPPTASLTPNVGIPTEVPTVVVTPTASTAATDAPTKAASATSSPTATATKARGALLLPMLGR